MNIVSRCCHESIVEGRRKEYPLLDGYHISRKVDICEECGKEADPVEACDSCGEPFDAEGPIETELGDYCRTCVSAEVDARAEQIKKEWGVA